VFDIHYNNVGNQVASPPDRPSSKITFGPGILAGLFHFVAITVMWRKTRLPLNRFSEHPAQCQPVDNSVVNAKPDNAACALVHYNQHPMRS
jgi:hypothetical protein